MKEKARIKGYLVKNEATNRVTVEKEPIGKDSLPIETEYTPVDSDGELTLLKVLLGDGPDPSDPRPSLLHRPSRFWGTTSTEIPP